MKKIDIINIGKWAFWLTFIIGNLCCFGNLATWLYVGLYKSDIFAMYGLIVMAIVFLINALIIIGLTIYSLAMKETPKRYFTAIAYMFLNIPIAAIYIYVFYQMMLIVEKIELFQYSNF